VEHAECGSRVRHHSGDPASSQVYDGGPDGDTATADNTVFARQGLFVP
jgi:hypothetical protein